MARSKVKDEDDFARYRREFINANTKRYNDRKSALRDIGQWALDNGIKGIPTKLLTAFENSMNADPAAIARAKVEQANGTAKASTTTTKKREMA